MHRVLAGEDATITVLWFPIGQPWGGAATAARWRWSKVGSKRKGGVREDWPKPDMWMSQNPKITGEWMFIPRRMVAFDQSPDCAEAVIFTSKLSGDIPGFDSDPIFLVSLTWCWKIAQLYPWIDYFDWFSNVIFLSFRIINFFKICLDDYPMKHTHTHTYIYIYFSKTPKRTRGRKTRVVRPGAVCCGRGDHVLLRHRQLHHDCGWADGGNLGIDPTKWKLKYPLVI